MNYATSARRPNPLAALGALGVPASFGVLLIAGLAVTQVIKPPVPNPKATDIPDVVITPTVIEPEQVVETNPQTNPIPQVDPGPTPPAPTPTVTLAGTGPLIPTGTLSETWGAGLEPVDIAPIPQPAPSFDPIAAAPRGNPGNWISTSDYRTSWIRRGYEGRARFTLEISASGKVTNCTVTGSTGHASLDRATCQLIERRAVFTPAKDASGGSVAGRYSSVVNWQIPQ